MHNDFADWYRLTTTGTEAQIQPDLLTRRWQGVEAAFKALKPGEEFELVRLLTGRELAGEAFATTFRGAFKTVDPSFSMHGNDLEVRVLAGATLAHALDESPATTADRSALGLVCGTALVSLEPKPWIPPFIDYAESYLVQRSRDARQRVTLTLPKFEAGSLTASVDAFAQSFATQDWAGKITASTKAAFTAYSDAVTKFARTTSQALSALAVQEDRRREESDVLWWVTSEYSRDLDQRFAEIKLPGAALVAGRELADIVSLPGPLAAKSFLDKVLSTCASKSAYRKPVALAAAVAATPKDWRTSLCKRAEMEKASDLTPVLGAVRYSLTTDGEKEWIPAYKKAFGVDSAVETIPTELAHFVYRECLLVKAAK